MSVEGVVKEGGARDDLRVVGGQVGEGLADRPQAGGLGRRGDLGGKVRPVDDPGQPLERGVAGQPLVDQLLEGAPAAVVAVGIPGAGGVEAEGVLAALDGLDLLRLDEADLRLRIEEAPHQPGGRRPVDVHTLAGHPLHRDTSLMALTTLTASSSSCYPRLSTGNLWTCELSTPHHRHPSASRSASPALSPSLPSSPSAPSSPSSPSSPCPPRAPTPPASLLRRPRGGAPPPPPPRPLAAPFSPPPPPPRPAGPPAPAPAHPASPPPPANPPAPP